MNNKPMLSVERELLGRLVKGGPRSSWSALDDDRMNATEELRALLTKSICKTCNDRGGVGNILNAEPCPDCEPAAQPQSEPVALTAVGILRDDGDGGLLPEWILEGGTAELWDGAILLVADDDQELCTEDGHCELYRHPVEQPAPVAVVLPEKLTDAEVEELEVIEVLLHGQGLSNLAGTMAAARQFIDEAARLNAVKP